MVRTKTTRVDKLITSYFNIGRSFSLRYHSYYIPLGQPPHHDPAYYPNYDYIGENFTTLFVRDLLRPLLAQWLAFESSIGLLVAINLLGARSNTIQSMTRKVAETVD